MGPARTKNDLIIEVWEMLDCENVGATEIEVIEVAVADRFGPAAIDSPMIVARLLADEGADLRHSEIMKLYVERASDRPYEPALRNIVRINDLTSTASSLKSLENLRRKYSDEKDKSGLRELRETVIQAKRSVTEIAEKKGSDASLKKTSLEIARWLTIWMQSPEVFETWLELRQKSPDFIETFGNIFDR